MKYIPGEIVLFGHCPYFFDNMSEWTNEDGTVVDFNPLPWQTIAALLAGNLRRAGYRVDGACVDADGWGWFWAVAKPSTDEVKGVWKLNDLTETVDLPNTFTNSSMIIAGFFVGKPLDWRTMIIEFPKDGE